MITSELLSISLNKKLINAYHDLFCSFTLRGCSSVFVLTSNTNFGPVLIMNYPIIMFIATTFKIFNRNITFTIS